MILILTSKNDLHALEVLKHLKARKKHYEFLDLAALQSTRVLGFLSEPTLKWSLSSFNSDKEKIDKIWYRRPRPPYFDQSTPVASYIRREFEAFIDGFITAQEIGKIFPNVDAIKTYKNKINQLKVASEVGFKIPKTVIGNNVRDVTDTFSRSEKLIVKPLNASTVRSSHIHTHDYVAVPKVFSVSEIIKDNDRLSVAPIIIQEYIEKKLELRITVVNENIFAASINSQASSKAKTDYRNDILSLEHAAYELPNNLKLLILEYMSRTKLTFACFDMILTPDEKFVFLECNTNGQWLWIEQKTGLPIAKAIADELIR